MISNLNVFVPGMTDSLLSDITFRVEPREKWAIVGSNGCGKSTLLKTITGNLAEAATAEFNSGGGGVALGEKERYGYLEQTSVSGKTTTVLEECQAGMEAIEKTRKIIETVTLKIENGDYR